MQEKDFLINLGLTDTEAIMYTSLLDFDTLSVSEIVKETGIQRTTIYHALETLEQKGLVSKKIVQAKLSYSANSPKNLERFLDHKIETIKNSKKELEEFLPSLVKKSKGKTKLFRVTQSDGIEGIKTIVEEALYCHSRKWEIIAPSKNFFSEFDKKYAEYFMHTRLENGIIARSLWESEPGRRLLTSDEVTRRNPRFLPDAMHGKFKSVVLLFDDKVAFISSFREKTAVLIQSQELHETIHAIFEGLWVNAKPYLNLKK